MQNLRLVGIHEDGEHLLLADPDGTRFQVPLDDALRAAVRRERPRAAGDQGDADQEPMRPRDVQALIRTGVTLEEVAERSGWDLEKVRRYEPPIRAERDHVASQAQALEVHDRAGATTLGDRVAQRLADRGVDAERVAWDSWKEAGTATTWKVVCLFPAGGRERRASWRFSPSDRVLSATDDEARWLGEDERASGPGAPAPRVAASSRNAAVYDVEAEGGVGAQVRARGGARAAAPVIPERQDSDSAEEEAVDMVSVMRERAASRRRRPKRQPSPTDTPIPPEEMPDEARPVEHLDLRGVEGPPQGSHARPSEGDTAQEDTGAPEVRDEVLHDPVTGTGDLFEDLEAVAESHAAKEAEEVERKKKRRRSRSGAGRPAPVADTPPASAPTDASAADIDAPTDGPTADDTVDKTLVEDRPESSESVDDTSPGTPDEAEPDATDRPEVPDRQRSTRKGRPSVPSWDDIMFGSRRED